MDFNYFIIGLNHKSADLSLRERVSIPDNKILQAQRQLKTLLDPLAIEQVILSTCNRTEFYFYGDNLSNIFDKTLSWLAMYANENIEEIQAHTYKREGKEAVSHIFCLACGLDSMAMGETQILGQLKSATRMSKELGYSGNNLDYLTQKAFNVAKLVRSETDIGKQSISLASLSIQLTKKIFGNLSNCDVLFIGAGEMINLCLNHISEQNPKSITLTNRDLKRGQELIKKFNGNYFPIGSLNRNLENFDVIISCTASSLPLVGLGAISTALKKRKNRPIVCIDLAVPRDFEPEVKKLDNVFLFSIDDLGAQIDENIKSRLSSAKEAREIIESSIQEFFIWKEKRKIVPIIQQLKSRSEEAVGNEVKSAIRKVENGAPVEDVLSELANKISNKFLHNAYVALNDQNSEKYSEIRFWIKKLYGIELDDK